jgi:hypothetical protein
MVGLLSLSNELLVQVFSSSDTIQSAATLSRVDKTMHSLWVTLNNQILANILPTQIVGYKDAKDLAILEEIWFCKNNELASETSPRPRVRLYLSTLLHNVKLATSATATRNAWLEQTYSHQYDASRADVATCHVAYCRMSKITLGRLRPEAQLQHVVYSIFEISSEEDHLTLAKFNMFLGREEHRHRIANWRYHQGETNAEGKEPVRHEFALLHGFILAEQLRYVSGTNRDWQMDRLRIVKEKSQKDALAMEIDHDEYRKSVLVMETHEENLKLQNGVLAAETKEKLLKSSMVVNTIMEKLRHNGLEARTVADKLMKSVLAWGTDELTNDQT